jgi:trans-2,3-dihydro-3-hydroxyanthranilate isomerase
MTEGPDMTEGPGSTGKRCSIEHVAVFCIGERGGNPAPVVLDAAGMSPDEMRAVAAAFGHEAGFVLPPTDRAKADLRYRFFVPVAEMDMCGHATLGTTWLLARKGKLPPGEVRIETNSGIVRARISDTGEVAVSQPSATIKELGDDARRAVAEVLGLRECDLLGLPLLNATTSRTKTLVPLADPAILGGLTPNFDDLRAVCEQIGSTGLYPFACDWEDERTYHARQFPAASGIAEDPATGVAATALFYGLRYWGLIGLRRTIRVRQGDALGRPSRMAVTLADTKDDGAGCWLSGDVRVTDGAHTTH